MSRPLILADADTARDLLTFAGRATRIGAEGVRVAAQNGIMTVQTATLSPRGLLDATPTVLGMRILHADPELVCDFVVATDALTAGEQENTVSLPDSALSPAWAGIAPPQLGWEHVGDVSSARLRQIAAEGIADVADLVPTDAGEDVVRAVRAAVWAPMQDDLFDAPKGVAFTADALGFLGADEIVPVFRNDRWTRLSTSRGHVLSRGPARVGMTEVRATGAAVNAQSAG